MKPNRRSVHRTLALVVAVPLVVSLLTGMTYRVGRAWFGLEKPMGDWILRIHTGAWLGDGLSLAYLLVAGLGLLAMMATGLAMLWKAWSRNALRRRHWILALVMIVPLAATAVTGLVFRVGNAAFGLSDGTMDWLMAIHQGSWLGPAVRPFYVIFLGLGLLGLILSGLRIGPWWRRH